MIFEVLSKLFSVTFTLSKQCIGLRLQGFPLVMDMFVS